VTRRAAALVEPEERRPAVLTTVVKLTKNARMSRHTMSFALPESMREYIDNRVAAGNYGNTSEYIRDLVRRDQEEQAKKRLRDLIEEGLASGPGRRRTKADEKELLAIARGEID
jgi:antitoxin ParD1/3/4